MSGYADVNLPKRSRFEIAPTLNFAPTLGTAPPVFNPPPVFNATPIFNPPPIFSAPTLNTAPTLFPAPVVIDTRRALAAVLESLGKAATVAPLFVPVTDATYIQRLEKALQKNFDFIRRKDSGQLKSSQKKSEGSSSGKQSNGQGIVRDTTSSSTRPEIGSNQQVILPTVSIQSVQPQAQTQLSESLSIYVSGLPTDIDEKDLEILFESQGSIKKIKIYTAPGGAKKGDALITYTRAEAAAMAVIQYNNLNIGEGFIISVSRASFTPTTSQKEEEKPIISPDYEDNPHGPMLHAVPPPPAEYLEPPLTRNSAPNKLRDALPAECLAQYHPVALLSRVYDPTSEECVSDPNFFPDLEADMLVECCKFGKVLRLVSPEGSLFDPLGCIAVTFEDLQSARDCASALHGRWFDSRQIETLVFSPPGGVRANSSVLSGNSSSVSVGAVVGSSSSAMSGVVSSSSSSFIQSSSSMKVQDAVVINTNTYSSSNNNNSSNGNNGNHVTHNSVKTEETHATNNGNTLNNGNNGNTVNNGNNGNSIDNAVQIPPNEEPDIDLPDVDDFLNSFL